MLHLVDAAPAPETPIAAIGDFLRTWPLIGTALLAVVPLYWPTFRWNRRLRADTDIHSKLPDSPVRARLAADIAWQTRRLLNYRETIGQGKYLFRSVVAISYVAAVPVAVVIEPDVVFPDGLWPGILLVLAPIGFIAIVARNIWSGRTPFHGLDPTGVVIRERVNRRQRRWKRWNRLQTTRRRRRMRGDQVRAKGSTLGFRRPVDLLRAVATDEFERSWAGLMVNARVETGDRRQYVEAYREVERALDARWIQDE